VRTETKKVTTPSWKEVQATTAGGDYYGVFVCRIFLFGGFDFGGTGWTGFMRWLAHL